MVDATYGAHSAGNPEATPWNVADWNDDDKTFTDVFHICGPAGINNVLDVPLTAYLQVGGTAVFNETQKFWIGSTTDFQGVCVQRGIVTLYNNHGSLSPYYTPITNKADCNAGVVLN
jgi:hypothetical protein